MKGEEQHTPAVHDEHKQCEADIRVVAQLIEAKDAALAENLRLKEELEEVKKDRDYYTNLYRDLIKN